MNIANELFDFRYIHKKDKKLQAMELFLSTIFLCDFIFYLGKVLLDEAASHTSWSCCCVTV